MDANEPYRGVKQRSSQLEETVRNLRASLRGSRWLEIVEVEQEPDVQLRILGRRKTLDQKFAIGYSLEAVDFDTEDEFVYRGKSFPEGGSAIFTDVENPASVHASRAPRWRDAARSLAESLEKFGEKNYARILAERQ